MGQEAASTTVGSTLFGSMGFVRGPSSIPSKPEHGRGRPSHPIVSAAWVVRELKTSKPTAGRALAALVDAGVLGETTGKQRDRSYAYTAYLARLREGTELEPR